MPNYIFEKMLLDNVIYLKKYPVQIDMDSLTINFKLYTLDETRLNFKNFDDQHSNLYQKVIYH